MTKATTIKVGGGADYARVAERLRIFREENPRGLIETTPIIQEDGRIMFKARVLKDKSDQSSAEATGHALSDEVKGKKEKAFEKIETIALGRALANLGYLASGEIASSEEMEEFENYKKDRLEEKVLEGQENLSKTKNLEELKTTWSGLPVDVKSELNDYKEKLKNKYDSQEV